MRRALVILCLGALLVLAAGRLTSCLDECTATQFIPGYPFIEACFADGNTYNVTLSDLGACYFSCGVGIRWLGTCGCANNCGADFGRGSCVGNACQCASGWGGSDCSAIRCPNGCSDHGICVSASEVGFTDMCECAAGWTGFDCATPALAKWSWIPCGQILGGQYYFDDANGDKNPVWNMSAMATIKITIAPMDYDYLINPAVAYNLTYRPASLEFHNGQLRQYFPNVGFKLRGSYSRKLAQKSWAISFKEFVKGQKGFGLKKLNLKTLLDDTSAMTNAIVSSWYRSVAVPVSRSSYTSLWVNAVWFGVYVILEDMDGSFLDSRFGDSNGNLYRAGKGRATMAYQSDDPSYYETLNCAYSSDGEPLSSSCLYEQASGDGNWTDFVHVIRTVYTSTAPNRLEKIGALVNLDEWIRQTAVETAIASKDSYASYGNNWFLYHRESDGLYYLMPLDFNEELKLVYLPFPLVPFNLTAPCNWLTYGPWNNIFLLQNDSALLLDKFKSYANRFTRLVFNCSGTYEQISQLQLLLNHSIAIDPYYRALGGLTAWERGLADLHTFIVNRTEYLVAQLPLPPTHYRDRLKPILTICLGVALLLLLLSSVGVWYYKTRSAPYALLRA